MDFFSSFATSFRRFTEFDVGNAILFEIKDFGGKNKETTIARHFINVIACPNFNTA